MFVRTLWFALAAVALVPPSLTSAQDRRSAPDPESFAKQELERLLRIGERLEGERLKTAATRQGTFDVLHYELSLDIDVSGESIAGTVTTRLIPSAASVSEVTFDLSDSMTVSDVRTGGVSLGYQHSADLLTVTLDGVYAVGDTVEITVDYGGKPGILNDELGIDVFAFGVHPPGAFPR